MAQDQPAFRVGYGEFASQFPRYRDTYAMALGMQSDLCTANGGYAYAHNELLHLWAECGLLGLLAFLDDGLCDGF